MLAGVALATTGLVPALAGFGLYALGGFVCVVATVVALVRLVRGRAMGLGDVVALAGALLLIGPAMRGAGLPRINDFTTDLADPPAFVHAATLPANAGRSLAYPPDFADQQRACCADLRAARLPLAPAEAFARAETAAAAMPGWVVTFRDPAAGVVEAVATTTLFGFQDDVVIRVRPDAAGAGSVVDVRSKSRDGKGDLGANAARIRTYVGRLEQGS
jgi:uncharacterized protein (DUF1499 family)